MTGDQLEITTSTTVHELLTAYPQLEAMLIEIAPPFKKLQNPFLRKSVAKVATIKHIAAVGGISLTGLIDTLRTAVGQPVQVSGYEDDIYFSDQPDWFSADKIVVSIDEAQPKNRNEMTVVAVLREAKHVEPNQIIELVTTFLPAPGIDILKAKGYSVWTHREANGLIKSYFLKNTKKVFGNSSLSLSK